LAFLFYGQNVEDNFIIVVMYLNNYILLFKRLGFSLIIFVLLRVLFYFYNLNYFSPFALGETVFAFFYGLRFDIATVLIVNLVFILITLLPLSYSWFQKFQKIIFLIFNIVFISINVIDLEFFNFLGKKMTLDIFDIAGDIKMQSWQLILNYWFFTLLVMAIFYSLYRFYPNNTSQILYQKKLPWYYVLINAVVIFILTAIGIRGGLQLRSISPKEAFIHESHELGNLSLNAAYTMLRSLDAKRVPTFRYYKNADEVKSLIKNSRNFEQKQLSFASKMNVVIIIMESFSMEYFEEGYMPFLKELSSQGAFFPHSFANGRRSIEALPSIMAGFPSLLDKPLYQSQFQSNKFFPLPRLLKQHNYQTVFFHGGKRGTMEFDSYCASIGFDQYFGKEDYPDQSHFDGNWGIYDHYFFDFFHDQLQKLPRPFFAGFFSLSSHQPYSIPPDLQKTFNKGTLEIHESIGYADYALKLFFERAKKQDWYNNTLFVITADHTSKLASSKFNQMVGVYRVPLLFYSPSIDLNSFSSNRPVQHADIMPSILHVLDINNPKTLYFGTSVFGDDKGAVLNYISGHYMYLRDNHLLRFDGSNAHFYKLGEHYDSLEKLSVSGEDEFLDAMLGEIKAYMQYTTQGLRQNNIYEF
jgi:phosphoglycerol transferase MdoB-like AlkP superfamily enzyme